MHHSIGIIQKNGLVQIGLLFIDIAKEIDPKPNILHPQ